MPLQPASLVGFQYRLEVVAQALRDLDHRVHLVPARNCRSHILVQRLGHLIEVAPDCLDLRDGMPQGQQLLFGQWRKVSQMRPDKNRDVGR